MRYDGSVVIGAQGSVPKSADDLLAPDILLPCQMPARDSHVTPERRLMLAILEETRNDLRNSYQRPSRKRILERGHIFSWLADDPGAAVSFEAVCDALGFEPATLRAGILQECRAMKAGKFPYAVRCSQMPRSTSVSDYAGAYERRLEVKRARRRQRKLEAVR